MKVSLIKKPGVLVLEDRKEPDLVNPTDVKMKVKCVGICGSDMHILHGTNAFAVYPLVWGHEAVGEVVEVGSAVTKVKPGDHIVAEPIRYCGVCYACKKGRHNACHHLKVMGAHIDGAAQEYFVLPEQNAFLIPREIPYDQAVLTEPFTIGAQACLRGRVEEGDTVLVMGAGTIGLTVLVNAKLLGAKVIISDIFDEKLEYARKLGADVCLNAKEQDVIKEVLKLTDGYGANVVVDAVCTVSSFEQAIDAAGAAGRIVEMSFNAKPSEIAPVKLAAKELTVLGSRHQTNRFLPVIEYLKAGKLPVKEFVTRKYPLSEVGVAFHYAEKNASLVRKILVEME
ncbi:MAG: zinc-binding alcohol dehydrogenase family protein [Hungatella sp.]|jgi:L-gulonate 5-dehydrogenase|nr:zinc-binding alcohol dehydrogenase family protein [Hungatella sp.]